MSTVQSAAKAEPFVFHPANLSLETQRVLALLALLPPGWYPLAQLQAVMCALCACTAKWVYQILRELVKAGAVEQRNVCKGRQPSKVAQFRLDPQRVNALWPDWDPSAYGMPKLYLRPLPEPETT